MIRKILFKVYKEVLWLLPKGFAHKIIYYRRYNTKLNLKNPSTFDEKIHYLMVNEYDKKYSYIADKYLVRNYVKGKGYGTILPKIYGIYNSVEKIEEDNLPNKFILKANHGSGENFYVICNDKKNSMWKNELSNLKNTLKVDFAKKGYEYHYSGIQRKIICEELLEDKDNKRLIDYKVHCLNGQPHNILVCSNRESELKLDFYNTKWEYLDYAVESYRSNKSFNKPINLDEMLRISEDLSSEFPFARIDFYEIEGRLYFGEITLTPAAGNLSYLNRKGQMEMGKSLKL